MRLRHHDAHALSASPANGFRAVLLTRQLPRGRFRQTTDGGDAVNADEKVDSGLQDVGAVSGKPGSYDSRDTLQAQCAAYKEQHYTHASVTIMTAGFVYAYSPLGDLSRVKIGFTTKADPTLYCNQEYSRTLCPLDIISIRGHGRARVAEQSGKARPARPIFRERVILYMPSRHGR